MLGAEQQHLHRAAEIGRAFDRQVRPGPAFGDDPSFGAAHRIEHRNAPGIVEVDADAEVDLVRPCIPVEVLVEAQDRVAGEGGNVLEHGQIE